MSKRPTYGKYLAKQNSRGYLRVWCPQRRLVMLEHRKVWLDSGKDIPPGFHVHHKNHDKQDNRLENLEVLSNSSHQKEHQYEGKVGKNQYGKFIVKCVEHRTSTKRANKLIPRECNGCKDLFTGKRSDAGYCSERCRIKYWKRKKALLLV